MHKLRKMISSANHLFAFEAVGRHKSFTAAAAELGVSQPAISKSIRVLEESLGLSLFDRRHRGLTLTAEGRVLYAETREAVDRLAGVIEDLRGDGGPPGIRMSFSSSFVTLWLVPHLSEFKSANPGVALHIEENVRDDIDLDKEGYAISSRLGRGRWPGLNSTLLARERVFAVCSPEFKKANPGLDNLRRLAASKILHSTERFRPRIGWAEWFEQAGAGRIQIAEELVFSDYHSAISAAQLGQGIALGWQHLVAQDLISGRLVLASPHVFETDLAIYLVVSDRKPVRPEVALFRDWIVERTNAELARLRRQADMMKD